MKRTSRFIVFTLAAGLTFGSLVAFVGPPKCNHHHGHPCQTMEKCDSGPDSKTQGPVK
jgi:hypothetical protein